jgi:hypothetical protein
MKWLEIDDRNADSKSPGMTGAPVAAVNDADVRPVAAAWHRSAQAVRS